MLGTLVKYEFKAVGRLLLPPPLKRVSRLLLCSAICLLIRSFQKNKDYMGFMMTMSFAVFTVIEAHAVSVYIARNYVLFLLGMCWCMMLGNAQKEVYWWKLPVLLKRR